MLTSYFSSSSFLSYILFFFFFSVLYSRLLLLFCLIFSSSSIDFSLILSDTSYLLFLSVSLQFFLVFFLIKSSSFSLLQHFLSFIERNIIVPFSDTCLLLNIFFISQPFFFNSPFFSLNHWGSFHSIRKGADFVQLLFFSKAEIRLVKKIDNFSFGLEGSRKNPDTGGQVLMPKFCNDTLNLYKCQQLQLNLDK